MRSSLSDEEKQAQFRLLPFQALCEAIGNENVFVFPYVFSDDPIENGKRLADSIKEICASCGCEKLSLLAVGCGSTIVNACLAQTDAAKHLAKLAF